jgi:branched-chain amino acid transport system ATP-binding protein
MNSLLQVERVAKSFRGLCAVAEVSFDILQGAIVALIGPNGAGKTTLFNMIAGALAPDSGAIWFDGARIDGLRPDQICARGIGRTFQIVKPFAGLSVLDNVVVGALQRAASVNDARRSAAAILDKVGLGAKRELPATALTLPDRKLLEIARALSTRPKLLLLDEALAGLRPAECDRLVALFRELHRSDGVTILLIEHVMRAVMALAQEMIVLHHGNILARGAPDRVVKEAAVLECYLGENVEL